MASFVLSQQGLNCTKNNKNNLSKNLNAISSFVFCFYFTFCLFITKQSNCTIWSFKKCSSNWRPLYFLSFSNCIFFPVLLYHHHHHHPSPALPLRFFRFKSNLLLLLCFLPPSSSTAAAAKINRKHLRAETMPTKTVSQTGRQRKRTSSDLTCNYRHRPR